MPNVIVRGGANRNGIRNDSFSATFSASKKGVERTASFTMVVVGESFDTTDLEILATPGLPKLYQVFGGRWVNEINPAHAYVGKHPDTGVDTQVWHVEFGLTSEINLENIPPDQDPLEPVNPIDIPADISQDSITQIMPFNGRDANGKIIANFFGEPLAEEIQNEVEIHTVSITRWEAWPFPFTTSQQFNNTCNQESFHGLPPGTCLMKIRSVKSFYDGVPYARVTYLIKVLIDEQDPSKEDTWVNLDLPHVSYQFLETAGDMSSARSTNVFNNAGPFLLNRDGTLSEFGNDFTPNSDNSNHTLTFARKRKVSWNSLNLPDR